MCTYVGVYVCILSVLCVRTLYFVYVMCVSVVY